MGCLWDLLFICTVTVLMLKLLPDRVVSPSFGFSGLLAFVFFRAMARGIGGSVSRQIRRAFTVGLPIMGIFLLAVRYGLGDPKHTAVVLIRVLQLVFALFGLYIMFRGMFPRR